MAYDNSIEQGYYDAAYDNWHDENLDDFIKALNDFMHPDFNTEFKDQMAASLCDNFIQTGNCQFFEYYAMTTSHAYCFLNGHTNGGYSKEAEAEFKDYLND